MTSGRHQDKWRPPLSPNRQHVRQTVIKSRRYNKNTNRRQQEGHNGGRSQVVRQKRSPTSYYDPSQNEPVPDGSGELARHLMMAENNGETSSYHQLIKARGEDSSSSRLAAPVADSLPFSDDMLGLDETAANGRGGNPLTGTIITSTSQQNEPPPPSFATNSWRQQQPTPHEQYYQQYQLQHNQQNQNQADQSLLLANSWLLTLILAPLAIVFLVWLLVLLVTRRSRRRRQDEKRSMSLHKALVLVNENDTSMLVSAAGNDDLVSSKAVPDSRSPPQLCVISADTKKKKKKKSPSRASSAKHPADQLLATTDSTTSSSTSSSSSSTESSRQQQGQKLNTAAAATSPLSPNDDDGSHRHTTTSGDYLLAHELALWHKHFNYYNSLVDHMSCALITMTSQEILACLVVFFIAILNILRARNLFSCNLIIFILITSRLMSMLTLTTFSLGKLLRLIRLRVPPPQLSPTLPSSSSSPQTDGGKCLEGTQERLDGQAEASAAQSETRRGPLRLEINCITEESSIEPNQLSSLSCNDDDDDEDDDEEPVTRKHSSHNKSKHQASHNHHSNNNNTTTTSRLIRPAKEHNNHHHGAQRGQRKAIHVGLSSSSSSAAVSLPMLIGSSHLARARASTAFSSRGSASDRLLASAIKLRNPDDWRQPKRQSLCNLNSFLLPLLISCSLAVFCLYLRLIGQQQHQQPALVANNLNNHSTSAQALNQRLIQLHNLTDWTISIYGPGSSSSSAPFATTEASTRYESTAATTAGQASAGDSSGPVSPEQLSSSSSVTGGRRFAPNQADAGSSQLRHLIDNYELQTFAQLLLDTQLKTSRFSCSLAADNYGPLAKTCMLVIYGVLAGVVLMISFAIQRVGRRKLEQYRAMAGAAGHSDHNHQKLSDPNRAVLHHHHHHNHQQHQLKHLLYQQQQHDNFRRSASGLFFRQPLADRDKLNTLTSSIGTTTSSSRGKRAARALLGQAKQRRSNYNHLLKQNLRHHQSLSELMQRSQGTPPIGGATGPGSNQQQHLGEFGKASGLPLVGRSASLMALQSHTTTATTSSSQNNQRSTHKSDACDRKASRRALSSSHQATGQSNSSQRRRRHFQQIHWAARADRLRRLTASQPSNLNQLNQLNQYQQQQHRPQHAYAASGLAWLPLGSEASVAASLSQIAAASSLSSRATTRCQCRGQHHHHHPARSTVSSGGDVIDSSRRQPSVRRPVKRGKTFLIDCGPPKATQATALPQTGADNKPAASQDCCCAGPKSPSSSHASSSSLTSFTNDGGGATGGYLCSLSSPPKKPVKNQGQQQWTTTTTSTTELQAPSSASSLPLSNLIVEYEELKQDLRLTKSIILFAQLLNHGPILLLLAIGCLLGDAVGWSLLGGQQRDGYATSTMTTPPSHWTSEHDNAFVWLMLLEALVWPLLLCSSDTQIAQAFRRSLRASSSSRAASGATRAGAASSPTSLGTTTQTTLTSDASRLSLALAANNSRELGDGELAHAFNGAKQLPISLDSTYNNGQSHFKLVAPSHGSGGGGAGAHQFARSRNQPERSYHLLGPSSTYPNFMFAFGGLSQPPLVGSTATTAANRTGNSNNKRGPSDGSGAGAHNNHMSPTCRRTDRLLAGEPPHGQQVALAGELGLLTSDTTRAAECTDLLASPTTFPHHPNAMAFDAMYGGPLPSHLPSSGSGRQHKPRSSGTASVLMSVGRRLFRLGGAARRRHRRRRRAVRRHSSCGLFDASGTNTTAELNTISSRGKPRAHEGAKELSPTSSLSTLIRKFNHETYAAGGKSYERQRKEELLSGLAAGVEKEAAAEDRRRIGLEVAKDGEHTERSDHNDNDNERPSATSDLVLDQADSSSSRPRQPDERQDTIISIASDDASPNQPVSSACSPPATQRLLNDGGAPEQPLAEQICSRKGGLSYEFSLVEAETTAPTVAPAGNHSSNRGVAQSAPSNGHANRLVSTTKHELHQNDPSSRLSSGGDVNQAQLNGNSDRNRNSNNNNNKQNKLTAAHQNDAERPSSLAKRRSSGAAVAKRPPTMTAAPDSESSDAANQAALTTMASGVAASKERHNQKQQQQQPTASNYLNQMRLQLQQFEDNDLQQANAYSAQGDAAGNKAQWYRAEEEEEGGSAGGLCFDYATLRSVDDALSLVSVSSEFEYHNINQTGAPFELNKLPQQQQQQQQQQASREGPPLTEGSKVGAQVVVRPPDGDGNGTSDYPNAASKLARSTTEQQQQQQSSSNSGDLRFPSFLATKPPAAIVNSASSWSSDKSKLNGGANQLATRRTTATGTDSTPSRLQQLQQAPGGAAQTQAVSSPQKSRPPHQQQQLLSSPNRPAQSQSQSQSQSRYPQPNQKISSSLLNLTAAKFAIAGAQHASSSGLGSNAPSMARGSNSLATSTNDSPSGTQNTTGATQTSSTSTANSSTITKRASPPALVLGTPIGQYGAHFSRSAWASGGNQNHRRQQQQQQQQRPAENGNVRARIMRMEQQQQQQQQLNQNLNQQVPQVARHMTSTPNLPAAASQQARFNERPLVPASSMIPVLATSSPLNRQPTTTVANNSHNKQARLR